MSPTYELAWWVALTHAKARATTPRAIKHIIKMLKCNIKLYRVNVYMHSIVILKIKIM